MNIQYKTIPFEKIEENCYMCSKNRLYVPGWRLNDFYRYDNHMISNMVIAYKGDIPVGCGVLIRLNEGMWFQVFVRKCYRRFGIGTGIFNTIKINAPILVTRHDYKSECFFNSLNCNLKNL